MGEVFINERVYGFDSSHNTLVKQIVTTSIKEAARRECKRNNYSYLKRYVKKAEVFNNNTLKLTFIDDVVTVKVEEGDSFDLYTGFCYATMKYLFGNDYLKVFRKLEKDMKKREEDKKKAEKEAEAKKAKKAKIAAKKEARRLRKKEEQIEIQKEAYLRAMKEARAD